MVDRESMSPFKLGLSVLWSAFWTALPIKLALALLFLAMGTMHLETKLGVAFLLLLISPVSVFAYFVLTLGMGVHIGEGIGFGCLLLLSIPIDIWALGLAARTIFLERLRVEPPESLGLSLWVRCAVAGAIYLPLLWSRWQLCWVFGGIGAHILWNSSLCLTHHSSRRASGTRLNSGVRPQGQHRGNQPRSGLGKSDQS